MGERSDLAKGLRRHVREGPRHLRGTGVAVGAAEERETKVCHLEWCVVGARDVQQILRLQVTVDLPDQ